MITKRFMPVLLIKNKRLINTKNFKEFDYIGDPINAVKIFSKKNVHELVIVDLRASEDNKIDYDYLDDVASQCFIPLTYIGGINSLQQMEKIYYLGFEKIGFETILFKNREFLKESVAEYGSSSVVASVSIKKNFFSKYEVYNKNLGKKSSLKPKEFIESLDKDNPGEILLNNISNDGMMKGYDLKIIDYLSKDISTPFTVLGGASNYEDMKNIAAIPKVTGIASGSTFIYSSEKRGKLINYPKPDGKFFF